MSPRKKKIYWKENRGKRGDKAAGGFGGAVSPPNGVKGAGVAEPRKILDFRDFYMPGEVISELLSS